MRERWRSGFFFRKYIDWHRWNMCIYIYRYLYIDLYIDIMHMHRIAWMFFFL